MASTTASRKTVLVADDTAFVRDRFRSALEGAGHRVVVAGSVPELFSLLGPDAARIDLIVVDLHLPQAGGVNLIRSIRRLDGGRITILVFSGTITNADEVRALAALGVAGYINEYSAAEHIMPSLAPHLFPDSFNRRGSPRVIVTIPVQYRFGNTVAAALTLNVSRSGVAIRTTTPLEAGSRIRVRFRLPEGASDVAAEGRVVWSDPRVGMGVQIEQVDATGQRQVDEFVDAHFFSNRRA